MEENMSDTNAVIAIYNTHPAADNAVKELQKSGFDMKKLSVVAKDYQTDEQVVGFYNAGDRMKYWGKLGAFWGGLFGLLLGAAIFWVPGIGPMVVAGPPCRGMDRRGFGGRGGRGRVERHRRRSFQYRHTQRQCAAIEIKSHQGGQVSSARTRNCRRGCQGQGHPHHHGAGGAESAYPGSGQASG